MPDKMIVTKAKLDALATSIATKSGESIPLTIAEMKAAVDGLTVGGIVISDTTDSHGGTVRTITAQNAINLQTKTITPTSSSQTISPDTGYDGFSQVTVGAGGYTITDIINRKYCSDITGAFELNATTVFPFQFLGCLCTSLSSTTLISANDGHGIGSYIFAYCPNLESINIPNFAGIGSGGYHFAYCTSLTDIYMPKCTTGQHMFHGCTSLVNIAIPNFGNTPAYLNGSAFKDCTSLKRVDLGNVSRIDTEEFSGCRVFDTLVLRRSDALTALRYTNAFNNTCFKSGGTGGTIYIPETLYNHLGDGTSLDYQSATNWSTIYGYGTITWAKIEGSPYENYYVDGREVLTEE